MKIYAVIDTNVIVSALLSCHQDSATVKILDYLYARTIVPVYDDEILEEYANVLRRTKFNFPESTISATLEAIKKGGLKSDRISSDEQMPDPKDIVFYEVALSVESVIKVFGMLCIFLVHTLYNKPISMHSMQKAKVNSAAKQSFY